MPSIVLEHIKGVEITKRLAEALGSIRAAPTG